MHIRNDPYDRHELRFTVEAQKTDPLTYGFAGRKELPGERLIHNRHLLGRALIVFGEAAAFENRNPKGFPIARRDHSVIRIGIQMRVGGQRPSFDFEASVRSAPKRQSADERRRLYSWQLPNLGQHLRRGLPYIRTIDRITVSSRRPREFSDVYARGGKSGFDMRQ